MGKGKDNQKYREMELVAGEYVPDIDVEYPTDDSSRKIAEVRYDGRESAPIDENYPYLDRSWRFKINYWINRILCIIFVIPMNRLRYGLKIKGKENLKPYKKLLKDGAMTVCNHVYRWDMLCVMDAMGCHKTWFPVYGEHLKGKDAWFIRYVGGIPVPETVAGMRPFNEAFDRLHEEKQWLHVFPEASSWRFYKPVRSFKKGAFTMAYKYNIPLIPCVISYRERTGFYRLFSKDEPLVTLNVGTPIIPDTTKARKEEIDRLLQESHAQMVKMAGITRNPWPAV